MKAWILTREGRDHGDYDWTVGVYGTLETAQSARVQYLDDALVEHSSNALLRDDTFTATLWVGSSEVEKWMSSSVDGGWRCLTRTT